MSHAKFGRNSSGKKQLLQVPTKLGMASELTDGSYDLCSLATIFFLLEAGFDSKWREGFSEFLLNENCCMNSLVRDSGLPSYFRRVLARSKPHDTWWS